MTPPIPKFEVGSKVFFRKPYDGIKTGMIVSVKVNTFRRITYIIQKGYGSHGNLYEILEDDIFRDDLKGEHTDEKTDEAGICGDDDLRAEEAEKLY